MDRILNELLLIESEESDLHKIEALKDTLEHVFENVKEQNQHHLQDITAIFKNKLKENPNFKTVVDNYVDKYVHDEIKKDSAKEDLFDILTAELLGMFRGVSRTTKCSIM